MNRLEIIPLGGIGEFGMNCMGIRYGDEMIVVDAGMGFPEETPFGVDISIPNFDFLEEYRDDLTAIVLTHGHEDHIGALSYILRKFNLPVYASRFTHALAEKRLYEFDMLDDVLLHRVRPNDVIEIGSFKIEFIHASHSLVDCFSLAIKTPIGTVIHTGDYKIDDTPVIGKPYDLETLARYGDEGVLALLGDSTNATVPGRTPSEQAVIPAFREIFEETRGRLFVSTFSSSLHRIQIIFDLAHEYGRKVCVLGRSMMRNVEVAEELGLLRIREGEQISLGDARRFDDDEVCYIVTGSQGEMRAALWNMATSTYKGIEIGKGDTVVLSARIIPGNEKNISRLIGHLYKRGANIIEEKRRLVHVSGHASQEDIRIMVETARPKFLVPIHGEYRMLFRHKEFVKNHVAGYDDDNIILIENGDVLELDDYGARVVEKHELHKTFIDEESLGEIEYEIVRERKRLAYGGAITLVVTVDTASHQLVGEPHITFNGVAGLDLTNGFAADARRAVAEAVGEMKREQIADRAVFRENLRLHLKRYVQKRIGTKPVIVTTVVEV
ncbi:MAG TPA: ribonuclease J [Pyrinomonadaceae bacterium]|nr:ribonuclease J [Pyrinomonadaceae bacterium]HMP66664.1 ribonuclease J [Pyrinomonadaceae bacterium]